MTNQHIRHIDMSSWTRFYQTNNEITHSNNSRTTFFSQIYAHTATAEISWDRKWFVAFARVQLRFGVYIDLHVNVCVYEWLCVSVCVYICALKLSKNVCNQLLGAFVQLGPLLESTFSSVIGKSRVVLILMAGLKTEPGVCIIWLECV